MERKIRIAIDGPAAAGKSTAAKKVAQQLSYIYIDTGAMYRALTYKALTNNVNVEDELALANLLERTTILLKAEDNIQLVEMDGIDVTEKIRSANVTNAVSSVAKHSSIRLNMVERQRKLAINGGIVMDGRDIGTKVIPDAELKIFLKASVKERAIRRHHENLHRGFPSELATIEKEIQMRDQKDTERACSPLKKAVDAIELDSTALTIDQVVKEIIELALERIETR
ncbi:(d)CMP kinase [Bacillus chungangensis]|uniref:Cytidylate kinase n=1 Tax=Bacillus chungangensis TaxID=587633 RepID=A0ABT9WYL2_9BACI|nr:(d)CMP kinase [Bacillus chungangensis]MDQ0178389.1 cytidylate kinase [Bacillus chungangensis]